MSREDVSDREHLVEIGKLAVLTGAIEQNLVDIAAALVSPDVPDIGYTVIGKQHFASVATFASRLVDERLRAGSDPTDDLLLTIRNWVDDARRG